MPTFTAVSESTVSLTEMRLNTATKIAQLKMEIERYQELVKLASETSVSMTEMRLTAAIKIAALRMQVEKCQQLEKPAAEPDNIVAAKKVVPVPTPTQLIDNNERHHSRLKKSIQNPVKTKISESDWVDKQAMRLLSDY